MLLRVRLRLALPPPRLQPPPSPSMQFSVRENLHAKRARPRDAAKARGFLLCIATHPQRLELVRRRVVLLRGPNAPHDGRARAPRSQPPVAPCTHTQSLKKGAGSLVTRERETLQSERIQHSKQLTLSLSLALSLARSLSVEGEATATSLSTRRASRSRRSRLSCCSSVVRFTRTPSAAWGARRLTRRRRSAAHHSRTACPACACAKTQRRKNGVLRAAGASFAHATRQETCAGFACDAAAAFLCK